MKNIMKKAISFGLALAMCAATFAAASVYFERKASMKVFSGRIEDFGATEGAPDGDQGWLSLSIGNHARGELLGREGDLQQSGVTFPILVDAYSSGARNGDYGWHDSNGKSALMAPVFVIRAEDGPVTGVSMKMELTGDTSAAEAVRFGVTAVHYIKAREEMTREFGRILDVGETLEIGDLLEGETVEIYVSAWVMSFDLERVEYTGGDFSAEAVFSYGEF